jgi:hypothetical protein
MLMQLSRDDNINSNDSTDECSIVCPACAKDHEKVKSAAGADSTIVASTSTFTSSSRFEGGRIGSGGFVFGTGAATSSTDAAVPLSFVFLLPTSNRTCREKSLALPLLN